MRDVNAVIDENIELMNTYSIVRRPITQLRNASDEEYVLCVGCEYEPSRVYKDRLTDLAISGSSVINEMNRDRVPTNKAVKRRRDDRQSEERNAGEKRLHLHI